MLEKFLNEKVEIVYTPYGLAGFTIKGVITAIDENFVELDNNEIIAIKFIMKVVKK